MNQANRLANEMNELATRMLISGIAWSIIGTLLFFGLLYLTLRYAIRDGLLDAQSRDWRTPTPRSRDAIPGPDLRAD